MSNDGDEKKPDFNSEVSNKKPIQNEEVPENMVNKIPQETEEMKETKEMKVTEQN